VILPTGAKWYDFWSGKPVGNGAITVSAPINLIPLFVRAGSILPFGPALQYVTEKPADPLEIRIYDGANGSFTLYEDENDNYNYEQGKYATISFVWNDAKQRLTIGERKGGFPGMLGARTFRLVRVAPGRGVGDQETADAKVVKYTGKAIRVDCR
jgi:alpha-D-xyloside xylohydrolase